MIYNQIITTQGNFTSEVVGSIPGYTHSSCDRGRLPDSVGFLLHYKPPNIVHIANNVLVDAQLSIQY
jgi:hypothetical protein